MAPLLSAGDISSDVYCFVNRLSDYLYIAARYVSMRENNPPKKWYKMAWSVSYKRFKLISFPTTS